MTSLLSPKRIDLGMTLWNGHLTLGRVELCPLYETNQDRRQYLIVFAPSRSGCDSGHTSKGEGEAVFRPASRQQLLPFAGVARVPLASRNVPVWQFL
jgi:hypothetical protein